MLARVTADLAVATPAFVDLTFVGLEALPRLGEERFAGELLRTPGGGAITAVAGARLGLRTALVAPLADDEGGEFVRRAVEAEGVVVGPPRGPRTPLTVVLPAAGERAMVTVDPGVRARGEDVAAAQPRAVVTNLELADVVPDGVRAYVTCGDDDARAYAGRAPRGGRRWRALVINTREAAILTGETRPAAAAGRLAELAEMALVFDGAGGAAALVGGRALNVAGVEAGPEVDPTGDRDLIAAALAWADLAGMPPEGQLRWAVLYAALAATVPTGTGGAVSVERLLAEGRSRGLALP